MPWGRNPKYQINVHRFLHDLPIFEKLMDEYLDPENWSIDYAKVAKKFNANPATLRYQIKKLREKKLLSLKLKLDNAVKLYLEVNEVKNE